MIGAPLLIATPAAVSVIAEAATSSGFDPFSLIGTLVTPVVVVILLLTGKIHTEGDYKRLASDLELEKDRTGNLQTALVERVIPALTKSTLVLENVQSLLTTEVHVRGHHGRSGGE